MNEDKIVTYPVVIRYAPDGGDYSYLVTIPDLNNGQIEGKNLEDALTMAKDYIGTTSLEEELPPANFTLPRAKEGETVTLVRVNVSEYRRRVDAE